MSTKVTSVPLLTLEQLCERWGGVSEDTVREHIKNDELPFVPLGRGKGKRPIYMFRLSAIEHWEANREKVLKSEVPNVPSTPPPSLAGMWDGKDRLGGAVRPRKKK